MKTQNVVFDFSELKGRIVGKVGSQEKLAEKLGITDTHLSRKLNNRVRFSMDDIVKLSEILEIAPEDIHFYFFRLKENK